MEDKPKPQASRSETPDSVEGPEQNGFWLTFKDVRLEAKFVQWQARLLMWVSRPISSNACAGQTLLEQITTVVS